MDRSAPGRHHADLTFSEIAQLSALRVKGNPSAIRRICGREVLACLYYQRSLPAGCQVCFVDIDVESVAACGGLLNRINNLRCVWRPVEREQVSLRRDCGNAAPAVRLDHVTARRSVTLARDPGIV